MERGAFEAIGLDPLHGPRKHVRPVVIEAEHEAAVHLNSVAMQERDPARVVLRRRCALLGVAQIAGIQRLETNEHAGAAGQRHLSNQRSIIGNVDRDSRAPNNP
jgi:hypothetical protein